MNADEIVDYYLRNSESTVSTPSSPSICAATIESWTCIDVGNQVVIQGQIHNHPRYPSGKKLKTSPLKDYFCNAGRVYVTTRNSMYELGMPHEDFIGDVQLLPNNLESGQWEKMTYWEE